MTKVYITTSKNGREFEAQFTSRYLAELDMIKNNYYNGLIESEFVSDAEFTSMLKSEKEYT